MTQNEKDLLLKDFCARLPYGVKAKYYGAEEECECIDVIEGVYPFNNEIAIGQYGLKVEAIKPYLFPLSSMTEEQKEVYCQLQQKVIYNSKGFVTEDVMEYVNWCYKNHIDINDLIPIGLAIDATGLRIYE